VRETVTALFQDAAFDPEAIKVLDAAYEKARASLHDIGQPAIVLEVIARRIIQVAQTGERDPDRLCAQALLALGFPPSTIRAPD
jgi:hypothetical protein